MPELWPFRPLLQISESLEWLSEVLPSAAKEQRISLRSAPRQTFTYNHIFNDHTHMAAKAFSRRNAHLSVYIPVWFESTVFGVVDASDTVLNIDTTIADYRADSTVLIWQDWNQFIVKTIDSKTDSSITLTEPVGMDFTKAIVMPCRTGFMTQGFRTERLPTAARATVRLQVTDNIDLNELGEFSLYPTYQSIPVMINEPHASASISESIIRTVEIFDNALGTQVYEPLYNFAEFGQTITFLPRLGAELWERRRWLHSLRGKQKVFWLPSFNKDLLLQNSVLSSGTVLTVKRISVPSFYIDRHIMIVLTNGTRYFRSITNAIINGDDDDITISSSLGVAISPSNVAFISFIVKTRLATDLVNMEHSVAGKVSIVLPTTEVSE